MSREIDRVVRGSLTVKDGVCQGDIRVATVVMLTAEEANVGNGNDWKGGYGKDGGVERETNAYFP